MQVSSSASLFAGAGAFASAVMRQRTQLGWQFFNLLCLLHSLIVPK